MLELRNKAVSITKRIDDLKVNCMWMRTLGEAEKREYQKSVGEDISDIEDLIKTYRDYFNPLNETLIKIIHQYSKRVV